MTAVGAAAHSGHLGQFFTPEPVARFCWQVVATLNGGLRDCRAVDPAAGEGVLLDAGCQQGWVRAESSLGMEIDPRLARPCSPDRALIAHADGLLDRPAGLCHGPFDVAVGNPPFGRARQLLTAAQLARLAATPDAPLAIWGEDTSIAEGLAGRAGGRPVEQLFLQRGLQLVREGGLVAYILPDGFLANHRGQGAREWVAEVATPLALIALPASAFRRPGLSALAHLVALRKGRPAPGDRTLLQERRPSGRGRRGLEQTLAEMASDLGRAICGEVDPGTVTVPCAALRRQRWDPGFWCGRRMAECWRGGPVAELGDFLDLLTYGPIVTGGRAHHVPGGVVSIRQGDFTATGLRRSGRLRVAAGSAHDPPRSRLRRRDLLLPRSGAGAVGRNRVAVYDEEGPANVGCFVDLLRLRDGGELNPYFLWIFLRSRPGWGQIRSLINGVGTPNISFREIRSLRVPVLPLSEQDAYEEHYRQSVLPLHRRGERSGAARQEADAHFQQLVARLEARLQGGSG